MTINKVIKYLKTQNKPVSLIDITIDTRCPYSKVISVMSVLFNHNIVKREKVKYAYYYSLINKKQHRFEGIKKGGYTDKVLKFIAVSARDYKELKKEFSTILVSSLHSILYRLRKLNLVYKTGKLWKVTSKYNKTKWYYER